MDIQHRGVNNGCDLNVNTYERRDQSGANCANSARKENGGFKSKENISRNRWWFDYFPVFLAFLVYSPNIFIEAGEDGFIYDDPVVILKNTCVMGSKHGEHEPLSCLLSVDYW
jgi:hypothetical protein